MFWNLVIDLIWLAAVKSDQIGLTIWVLVNGSFAYVKYSEFSDKRKSSRPYRDQDRARKTQNDYFPGISDKHNPVAIIRCASRYEQIFADYTGGGPKNISQTNLNWHGEWAPPRRARSNRRKSRKFWKESEHWNTRKSIFGNMCAYCAVEPSKDREHATPKSRGGEDSSSNILPACRKCNLSNQQLTLTEYVEKRARTSSPVSEWIVKAHKKEKITMPSKMNVEF